jgi:hypothetical protein
MHVTFTPAAKPHAATTDEPLRWSGTETSKITFVLPHSMQSELRDKIFYLAATIKPKLPGRMSPSSSKQSPAASPNLVRQGGKRASLS